MPRFRFQERYENRRGRAKTKKTKQEPMVACENLKIFH